MANDKHKLEHKEHLKERLKKDEITAIKKQREGHRERLRERFKKGGMTAVADYEILELMLFATNTRKDVKPLAKELLARFKTVAKVMQANASELEKVKGVGPATSSVLKAAFATSQLLSRAGFEDRTILSSFKEVAAYCRLTMSHLKTEQLRLLFLDKNHHLLRDEIHDEGTTNQTLMIPRKIIQRCLELEASGLIIVHNHPSGNSSPSNADIHATNEIKKVGEGLQIVLCDHIVVGNGTCKSLRNSGLIQGVQVIY